MHPDQKYIDALLTNDAGLLDELYHRFSGKIKWMVLQNSGTESDAADIFQEALLSIYNKARSRDFVLTCPLDAFLYVVCKNKWLNELSKKQHRQVTITDQDGFNRIGEDSFHLAEECMLLEARKRLLIEKLSQLGESCRQVLELSWSGKAMEEVARLMHISYAYARKKKCECMEKLVMLIKQSPEFMSLKW
jgi:RNA polymerase sigma factor (sigma-70 family)